MFKRLLKNNVKLCAVVKADAYGLGVANILPIISEYADFYAVANVEEAMIVRGIDGDTPVLVLAPVPIADLETCVKYNISITVDNYAYLQAISNNLHSSIKIHLKVNTGLNRFGFSSTTEFNRTLKLIQKDSKLILQGVYTHFATKGGDIEYINIQKDVFNNYIRNIPKYVIRHCANSFATLLSSTNQMNMVRIGANMYGDIRDEKIFLKDVLTITSEIISIHSVNKGQTIGYDRTYICTRKTKIAVVPFGYADGMDRGLSNRFYVLIDGKRVPIVGRICMDCFMIDVTDIRNVYIGSKVVIIGESVNEKITVMDMAKVLNRSPYEILVNFNRKRCNTVLFKKEKY